MTERVWIDTFAALSGAPGQVNRPWESDAELLDLGGVLTATTVDTVSEELSFLHDPASLGWAAVLASVADLAAVGAQPRGLLLSLELPLAAWEPRREALLAGVRDALRAHHTPLLGGDTNNTPHVALTTVGLGVVTGRPLLRSGARPGDGLYVLGTIGAGNLVALEALSTGGPSPHEPMLRTTLPVPAWLATCGAVSACTDSSDGLLAAVAHLSQASGHALRLEVEAIPYAPEVRAVAAAAGLPALVFAAAGVGEHALVFTVPEAAEPAWRRRCAAEGLAPTRIGSAATGAGVGLRGDRPVQLSPAELLSVAALRRPEEVLAAVTGW